MTKRNRPKTNKTRQQDTIPETKKTRQQDTRQQDTINKTLMLTMKSLELRKVAN